MNPLYKYGLIALSVVVVMFSTYSAGVHSGKGAERSKWLAEQNIWLTEISELNKAMAERKKEHEVIVSRLEENHLKEVREIEQSKDSIISELRAGNIKLRERFTRQARNADSRDTATTAAHNAAGSVGLSNNDAEFLIRFAASCDATANQLIAAQNYIKSLEVFR